MKLNYLKVITDAPHEDSLVMEKYLTQIGWDTTNYYKETGVYVEETYVADPNDDHYFQAGDTLYFKYDRKDFWMVMDPPLPMNGFSIQIWEMIRPLSIVHGQQSYEKGSFMLGFPQALRSSLDTLRLGCKATFVLPSVKAYGDKGLINSQYGYIIVPKYQTVVYDIEAMVWCRKSNRRLRLQDKYGRLLFQIRRGLCFPFLDLSCANPLIFKRDIGGNA